MPGDHAGYGWGDRHWQGETFSFPIDSDRFRYDPDGVLLGAQVRYNRQKDQFVFGVEADIAWVHLKDSVSEDFGSGIFGVNIAAASEVTWPATVRGRAGVTFDRVLLYGTGGIAFAGVKDVDATRTGRSAPQRAIQPLRRTQAGRRASVRRRW